MRTCVVCMCACARAFTPAGKPVNYTTLVSEAGESWVPEEPKLYSGTKESDVSSPSDCLHLPLLGWFLETPSAFLWMRCPGFLNRQRGDFHLP